ncbi:hypothetical protein B0H14DRAFT_3136703 [Mycena olivaceomarginata]|nr:hypothetical protein B0H14DRAFT_3136703 [Mycena olivaceomarginata]
MHGFDVESLPEDLPSLHDISDSESDASDDEGDNSDTESMPDLEVVDNPDDEAILAHSHRAHAAPSRTRSVTPPKQPLKRAATGKGKITRYWKAVLLEKDAREYSEWVEEARLREVEEKWKQKVRDRERGNERMRRHRDHVREAKIADGWIPGKQQKRAELADHDEISSPDPELPEHSRPHRQFKEDSRKNNKPTGRKRTLENKERDAKYTNWFHPILFYQVQAAASRVPKPWKPRAILRELHRTNLKGF